MNTRISKNGFTLVELLVVISIIMLLTMVVFASFEESRKKARDSARAADLARIQSALEIYGVKHGSYPAAGNGTCSGANSFASGGCLEALVSDGLLAELPADPTNAGDQIYKYDNTCSDPAGSSGTRYRLWTIGEREHDADDEGWTDSKTIGQTNCSDPQ